MSGTQSPDFRAMAMNRDLQWEDISDIKWDDIPVTGDDAHVFYSRTVAGQTRDFVQFYTSEEQSYQIAVERWLTRYSQEHTSPELRG